MKRLLTAAAIALLTTSANADQCGLARAQYSNAAGDAVMAIDAYSRCLAGSAGKDTCTEQFDRLKKAQNDFIEAVSFSQTVRAFCRW